MYNDLHPQLHNLVLFSIDKDCSPVAYGSPRSINTSAFDPRSEPMSREPTKHQLSSRLSYQQHTPAFLRRLQKNYGGSRRGDDGDEEDEPTYGDGEFEDDGSGRPPIPVRPSIPERPKDNPGSEGEDVDDEKPQVVVLKEGKHLTEREVQNEKRRGMFLFLGLQPLTQGYE